MHLSNATISVGIHKFIKNRVQCKNSAVYISGCPCHMIMLPEKLMSVFVLFSGFEF